MNRVSNGKVKNINLINSMGFHIHVVNCYMLRFFGLKITAPADSPNTDGIHISKSTNVRFYRNVISTGDDCVSIGQGSTNVTIEMITCGPGHGIRSISVSFSKKILVFVTTHIFTYLIEN